MTKALKVRPDNVWYIINYGKELNADWTSIREDLFIATQDGFEIYVITDGSLEENNVTFETWYASTFLDYWKFTSDEKPYEFVEVESV